MKHVPSLEVQANVTKRNLKLASNKHLLIILFFCGFFWFNNEYAVTIETIFRTRALLGPAHLFPECSWEINLIESGSFV